ncbi:hypothetical protein [Cronobacter sakazakii]|uniref:hypothetical protein n=1 Tax=Cronobacter sakazakii TaxID=28141 RepID=UPI0015E2EFBC|nr:hypothetical protein [Cronobacter sakazakii]
MSLKKFLDITFRLTSTVVEGLTGLVFNSPTRKEIKKKVAELEQQMLIERYKVKLNFTKKSLSEADKKDIKFYFTRYEEIESINDITSLKEKIMKSFDESSFTDKKEREATSNKTNKSNAEEVASARQENLKNETVVNLFLLSEKNKLLKTKILAVFITILSALTIAFMDMPFWAMAVGVALFILAEAKDQIVSYRVTRGYFGTNTSEALQLIKFIRENADRFDSNDGDGRRRKILNPEIKRKEKIRETSGGLQNV